MNTWKVEGLRVLPKVDSHENVVVMVEWSLGPLRQIARLTRPSDDFIPFPQLTEEVVLDWVWSLVNKTAWETRAEEAGKIADAASDAVNVALPWA